MRFPRPLAAALAAGLLAAAAPAEAQPAAPSPHHEATDAAPPLGLAPGEIEGLREGRGMGLARAADVNGYPGPRHLLDAHADGTLLLTADQLAAVRGLHAAMAGDARRLGAAILREEAELEGAFRAATIGTSELDARLARIGALRAELRGAHLRAHLATRALLTDAQVAHYRTLRGPARPGGAGSHGH